MNTYRVPIMSVNAKIEIYCDFCAEDSIRYEWIYEEYFQTKLYDYVTFDYVRFIQDHQDDERLIDILRTKIPSKYDLEDLDISIVTLKDENYIGCIGSPIIPPTISGDKMTDMFPVTAGAEPAKRKLDLKEFAREMDAKRENKLSSISTAETPKGMTRVTLK